MRIWKREAGAKTKGGIREGKKYVVCEKQEVHRIVTHMIYICTYEQRESRLSLRREKKYMSECRMLTSNFEKR